MSQFTIEDIPKVLTLPTTEESSVVPPPEAGDPVFGIPQSSAPPVGVVEAFGSRPWDDEEEAYQKSVDDWRRTSTDKIDAAIFEPDKTFKGVDLSFASTPQEGQRGVIVDSWMDLHHDEPTAPSELQRAVQFQLASFKAFGEIASSEEELYPLIQKDATQRKDVKEMHRSLGQVAGTAAFAAAAAAVALADPVQARSGWAAARDAARKMPGYSQEHEPDLHESYYRAETAAREALAPFAPEVKELWNSWQEASGAGKIAGVTAAVLKSLVDAEDYPGQAVGDALDEKSTRRTAFEIYDKLTPEERPRFMQAISVMASSVPKEEQAKFYDNIGKQSGRDLETLGQNAVTATVDFFANSDNWDTSSATGEVTPYRRRADFVQQLQNVREGQFDPVKKVFDGWWAQLGETVAYGTTGVVATSVMAFNPVTAPILFASLTENHYQSLLQGQMDSGVDYETASAYATRKAPEGAAIEMISEMFGSRLLRGKLPFFDKFLTGAMDKLKNPLLRGATRFVVGGTEEGLLEAGQNYIDPTIRGISKAFGEDTGEIIMPSAQENIEAFVLVLPLALMGIPGAAGRDARVNTFAAARDVQLAAAGYTEEGIQNIRAGIAAGLDSGAAAIDREVRDPNSESAKSAVEELMQQAASQRQAKSDLERLGYAPPTFVHSPAGVAVFDADGQELGTAPHIGGAVRIANAHTTALENMERDQVGALGSLFEATAAAMKLDAAAAFDVSLGEFDPAQATPAQAARYAQQVALQEQAEGGTGDIARSVLGYSVTSFAQGLRNTVNHLFKGASIPTVFHETFHGLRRAAHEAGTITRAMEISLLMNHDASLGARRVRDSQGKQTGAELRFIPAGITAEMLADGDLIPAEMIPADFAGDGPRYAETLLDEGISEIAEVEVMNLRKGQGKGKLGITRELVSRNLTSLAALQPGVAGSWKAFFAAVRAHWGLATSRAIVLMRAEKNGEFDPAERETYLNKLLGLDAQEEHDAGVQDEFSRMLGGFDEEADDNPFSIGRSTVTPAEFTKDSKMTKMVYHGSPDVRDIIKDGFKKSLNRGDVYFFSEDYGTANTYADDRRAMDYQNAEPHTLPVYLSLKNPLEVDAKGQKWRDTEKHIQEARAGGHDGIIIKNSRDEYNNTADGGKLTTVYAVFSPEQIKSASTSNLRSRIDGMDLGMPSFSIGRSTVTPTAATRTFQGAEGSPSVIGPASFSIGAYHGTPHKVDKFSLDKIGTGEGAQAYGWGLYMASSREVAEGYQKKLSEGSLIKGDGTIFDDRAVLKNLNVRAVLNKTDGDILAAIARAHAVITSSPGTQGAETAVEDIVELEKLQNSGGLKKVTGNLYAVTLKVEEEDLLDWDKPLSEQSEKVQSAIQLLADERTPAGFLKYWFSDAKNGRDILMEISLKQADPEASRILKEAGIPGIRYLDGNSRADGEGSYNYVIFDAADIEITEENGTPVEMGGVSFSLGKSTILPPTTQKSRTIAGPASIGLSDSNRNIAVFQSDPGEPGDVSPRGDGETDTSFSLGRPRENYERLKNLIPKLSQNLQVAESALRMGGGSMPFNAPWPEGISEKRREIAASYVRPGAGEEISYNGSPARISEDAERVIYGPGQYQSDPIAWIDNRLITQKLIVSLRESLAQAEADLYLAEEDFDPEADARLADADKLHKKELSKRAAMFAAALDDRDEEAKNAGKYFIVRVWNAYGKHEAVFQNGRTTSKDATEIAKAVSSPGKLITVVDNGDSIRVQSKNGYLTILSADTARPIINAPKADSQGKKEGGGSQIYAVAFDWIHNNKKRVQEDSGLTGINWVRRTSNMAASAIRWGTTRHLKPHASQSVGKWTKNDVLNTSLLITKEMENTHRILPESRGLRYDFAGDRFTRDGTAVTTSDLATLIEDTKSFDKGIGLSTLQRAIITASAIEEFQRGTAESIVESAESALPDSLTGVSYSLGPAQVAGILSDNALGRVTDPQRRAAMMGRIAKDFQAIGMTAERAGLDQWIGDTKGELRKKAAMMEELLAEQYVQEVEARRMEILSVEDLTKIKAQPVNAYLAVKRANGSIDPFRGRLRSKAKAMEAKGDLFASRAGDYDGADGVSRAVFGGNLMPDQAAQELFDNHLIKAPTADAMWEALKKEQDSVATFKTMLAAAQQEIRDAKIRAKKEATDWGKAQMNQRGAQRQESEKAGVARAVRMLDAIMMALPEELRGAMGGHSQITGIRSGEAMLKFLEAKLEKADKLLENYLRKQARQDMEALLEKVRPEKDEEGQRPMGRLGPEIHDMFDFIETAMSMNFQEAEDRIYELEGKADRLEEDAEAGDSNEEEAAALRYQAQIVNLFGNWEAADAHRRIEALAVAAKLYDTGRMEVRTRAGARKRLRQSWRESLVDGAGTSGERMDRIRQAEKRAETKIGRLKDTILSLFSYSQILKTVFGEESAAVAMFTERERLKSNAKADSEARIWDGIDELFARLGGNARKGDELRWKLASERTLKVTDFKGREQRFTSMEAITALLMFNQEDGKRHMGGKTDEEGNPIDDWHWREEDMKVLRDQLTPEARAVMFFLRESYEAEYDRVNEVFRRMFEMNMPKHKFYSQLTVIPFQGSGAQAANPLSGAMTGPGLTAGSLKNRTQTKIAEPDFKDALQVFIGHTKQMEHFIHYAELAQDMGAVFNNREVGNAIQAKTGVEAMHVLRGWANYFAQGGVRDEAAHLAGNRLLSRMLGRLTTSALVGRVGVLAIQSTQLGAAAFEMPGHVYLKQLAKLTTGQLNWGDAIRSDYMQRRMLLMPPVVREAMAALMSSKPSMVKHASRKMGNLITGADGYFTAGTFAMVYDWQLSQNGGDKAAALAEAERITDRVAQPIRAGERSLLENTSVNPAFRIAWAFGSEARQKTAIVAYDMINKNGLRKVRGLAIYYLLAGVLATVIRSISRDLRSDDDDEWLDERNWDPKRLALLVATSPLQGIPIIGKEIEAGIFNAFREYHMEGSLLDAPGKAIDTATGLPDYFKGEKDFQDALKDAETIMGGVAPFSDGAAAAVSISHVVRDLYGIISNLEGTD